jgi:hypothetical protein
MNKRILALSAILMIWVISCEQNTPPPAASTPTPASTLTPAPTLTLTPTVLPVSTADLVLAEKAATLYEQNFETEESQSIADKNHWSYSQDAAGNHFLCNAVSADWQSFKFGSQAWTDYAVEMRVKFLEQRSDQGAEVYTRIDDSTEGYRATLNYMSATLAYYPPYRPLANPPIITEADHWYTFRVETAGSKIKFYIDDRLLAAVSDSQRLNGMSGFGVAPNTKVCVDDIRVWLLNSDGSIGLLPTPIPGSNPDLEVVTDNAATGDGGNAWGGHQTRIVRTNDGVFTAYTVVGGGYYAKKWQLARRQDDGTWPVIAEGDAGREPVNLLASPDGTLHIIGWPNGRGTMWSGKPDNNTIDMAEESIPNVSHSDWPYNSAGIDKNGDICVLSSVGGETPGGTFLWSCYSPSKQKWNSQTTFLDYRYCYTYLFPDVNGSLAVVSTRDVRWAALDYNQPAGEFGYVFNAFGYWLTDDFTKNPLKRLYFVQEKPTDQFPDVYLDAQQDAYLDMAGNMHVLYAVQGASTQGAWHIRQAVLSPDGQLLNDVQLPDDIGGYARIFQDAGGRFYILGSSGLLYPAGMDGLTLGTPLQIDLGNYTVEYSGFGISAPRTGTLPGNVLDVVFPSSGGHMWIYFQLTLPGN